MKHLLLSSWHRCCIRHGYICLRKIVELDKFQLYLQYILDEYFSNIHYTCEDSLHVLRQTALVSKPPLHYWGLKVNAHQLRV